MVVDFGVKAGSRSLSCQYWSWHITDERTWSHRVDSTCTWLRAKKSKMISCVTGNKLRNLLGWDVFNRAISIWVVWSSRLFQNPGIMIELLRIDFLLFGLSYNLTCITRVRWCQWLRGNGRLLGRHHVGWSNLRGGSLVRGPNHTYLSMRNIWKLQVLNLRLLEHRVLDRSVSLLNPWLQLHILQILKIARIPVSLLRLDQVSDHLPLVLIELVDV